MKISKLFHWLYAFLMLLPIFAIGSSCLINTFNMSSKEETEVTYKYETNEVNNESDLVEGNIYHFTFNFENLTFTNLFECGNIYNIQGNANSSVVGESTNKFRGYAPGSTAMGIYAVASLSNTGVFTVSNLDNHIFECDLVYSRITYLDSWENYSISTFNVIENIETNNVEAKDVFYYSIDKVQQSPLFNWAENSFLVTPFAYIVNLFSMPTNSPIVMFLSYWLAISIIWLVFDLIMYVPLLVHRWLDKGVLE